MKGYVISFLLGSALTAYLFKREMVNLFVKKIYEKIKALFAKKQAA